MYHLGSLLLCVLLIFSLPAYAQTAVIDASLVTQASAVISQANASTITELASWNVAGVTGAHWAGDRLAIATRDAVLVYDLQDLTSPPIRIALDANYIALSADGRLLAVANHQTVRLWRLQENRLTATLEGTGPLAFVGTMLAYTDGGSTVLLWESVVQTALTVFEGHTDRITALDFSPNGDVLATTSLDTTVRIWDTATGEQIGFSRSRRRPLLCADFSPSGAMLATGAQGGILRLNNFAVDTEQVLSRSLHADITNIHFNPQNSMILFTVGDLIQFWNVGESSVVGSLMNPGGVILDAMFNSAGTMIVTVDISDTIRLWGVPAA